MSFNAREEEREKVQKGFKEGNTFFHRKCYMREQMKDETSYCKSLSQTWTCILGVLAPHRDSSPSALRTNPSCSQGLLVNSLHNLSKWGRFRKSEVQDRIRGKTNRTTGQYGCQNSRRLCASLRKMFEMSSWWGNIVYMYEVKVLYIARKLAWYLYCGMSSRSSRPDWLTLDHSIFSAGQPQSFHSGATGACGQYRAWNGEKFINSINPSYIRNLKELSYPSVWSWPRQRFLWLVMSHLSKLSDEPATVNPRLVSRVVLYLIYNKYREFSICSKCPYKTVDFVSGQSRKTLAPLPTFAASPVLQNFPIQLTCFLYKTSQQEATSSY